MTRLNEIAATTSILPRNRVVKHTCTCGREFTHEEWEAAARCEKGDEMQYADFLVLEFRNCPCNGTMAVDVLPAVLRVS